jgi:hypothetical protein
VKVKEWVYLYQAVDKCGDTIDFYPSPTRNAGGQKRPGQGAGWLEGLGKAGNYQRSGRPIGL